MTSTLTTDQHATITNTLGEWGADPALIAQLLADAAFGPGAIGWPDQPQGIGAGVGILVDETRDPDLAAVFDHRRTRDDQEFVASFQASPARLWAILSPDTPEALIGVQAAITRPRTVRRTFLLLGSRNAPILTFLTSPGSTLWLVPHHIGMRHGATEGTRPAYDIWGQSLPLGQTTTPMQAVELALKHIGRLATRR